MRQTFVELILVLRTTPLVPIVPSDRSHCLFLRATVVVPNGSTEKRQSHLLPLDVFSI